MSSRLDEEKIKAQFEKMKHKAERVIEDRDQVKNLAEKAWAKAKELQGPLAQVWGQFILMIQMLRAWFAGDYKELPTTSLIAIVGGLLYLLSPIDVIPDFIPVIGYLDDIFVLGVVFTQVAKDLAAFAAWRDAGTQQPTSEPVVVNESAIEPAADSAEPEDPAS